MCRKFCPPSTLLVVPSQWAKTTLGLLLLPLKTTPPPTGIGLRVSESRRFGYIAASCPKHSVAAFGISSLSASRPLLVHPCQVLVSCFVIVAHQARCSIVLGLTPQFSFFSDMCPLYMYILNLQVHEYIQALNLLSPPQALTCRRFK